MIKFETFLEKTGARLDDEQRKAVFTDTNCVVSAGAGSGKTTVLSYRFARLVLEGKADCTQILTLTFTRKAAREMHQRIHRQLLLCKEDPDIAKQLATFGDASISTLDSFCSTIVRSQSLAYGIASDFTIDDEKNVQNARMCITDLLETWPQQEGARLLSTLYNPDQLVDAVLVRLATDHYYLPKTVGNDVVSTILRNVEEAYRTTYTQFGELLHRYASFGDGSKTVTVARDDAKAMLIAMDECSQDNAALLELLGSNIGYHRKPGQGKGEDHLYLRETIDSYYALRRKLCIALSILTDSSSLEAVVGFVDSFIKAYQEQKRATGILTFADVSSLAVQILLENPSLRRYYKAKYRYIMIDEFQDNNEQQKQLLYLLAERTDREKTGIPLPEDLQRDKLFFVGDEKQSIYRFRGSDVSVFKSLSAELESIGGKSFSLKTNYRSEPDLIDWFNTLFPHVMQNHQETYEADFFPLRSRPASPGIKSSCTLLVKEYDETIEEGEEEEAKDADSEAYAVASLVDRMLHSDEYLIPSPQGPRRPLSSDIALLLRTTSSQLSFEKAFRLFDIPYTVQTARSLMLEAPANDLYAMLQLLVYPEDRHAYATVLRSPFCNLSDRYLAAVLDTALFCAPAGLPESEIERLDTLKQVYESLLKSLETCSLSHLMQRLWYTSGYALSLASQPKYHVYIEHYTFLHRLAEMQEQQGKSVIQFLDFLRENLAQNEKIEDLAVIKEEEAGVQIMSIHKSKGLEFPIVVVANTGSKGRGNQDLVSTYAGIALPHYLDRPFFVGETKREMAWHAGQLEDDGKESAMDLAELKRVLYVALTRAETHLVISGCFTKGNRSLGPQGEARSLLLLLTTAIAQQPLGILKVHKIESIAEKLLYRSDEKPLDNRLQASLWYEMPKPDFDFGPLRYAVTSLAHQRETVASAEGVALPLLESDAILSRYKEEQITAFGTFVHALCEAAVLGKSAVDPLLLMGPTLKAVLGKQELETLAKDGQFLCNLFLDSDFYATQVAPYKKACEVGFFSSLEQGGQPIVVEGSIDLLVEQPQRYLVIDFKTDKYRNSEVHRFQLQTYMQAVHRIYSRPVQGCVVYLRDVESTIVWEGEEV